MYNKTIASVDQEHFLNVKTAITSIVFPRDLYISSYTTSNFEDLI